MTYDGERKRVVLFGGADMNEQLADTWEWPEKSWKQMATAGPSARGGPQMAYDSRRQRVGLFGGFDQAKRRPLGDTWERDGKQWKQIKY